MKIIDLSHVIHADIPVFPGTEQPQIEQATRLENDGFIEHKITMFTHTGTHIDVPAHITEGGLTIDQLDINNFMGKAAVINLTGTASEIISIDMLKPSAEIMSHIDFVILKTGWEKYWGHHKYFKGFPVLQQETAEWLGTFTLKGIGIDTISVEPIDSKTFPVHRILFKNNILIVENLAHLNKLGNEIFTFSCLPLKIKNGDGSPVRAVGMV